MFSILNQSSLIADLNWIFSLFNFKSNSKFKFLTPFIIKKSTYECDHNNRKTMTTLGCRPLEIGHHYKTASVDYLIHLIYLKDNISIVVVERVFFKAGFSRCNILLGGEYYFGCYSVIRSTRRWEESGSMRFSFSLFSSCFIFFLLIASRRYFRIT